MPLDYPIHRRTLPNGLRVVVSPDHTVPNVTVNLWVGVGSRHEQPGRTGFAHLFEHLMFQGSREVRSGEHFDALMAEGARLNATTWFDRTNYFETVPDRRPRAGAVARGRPARPPPRRRDPGEPRQPARRRQGGEAAAVRQPAVRQRAHRRLRHGVPRGAPVPPPDHRLDGGPRRREPRGRPRLLPSPLRAGQHGAHPVRRHRARPRVRPRRAVLRSPGRPRRAPAPRPAAARAAHRPRSGSSAARTSPTTGCTSPSASRSTAPTTSTPPRWPWTASAGCRARGSCAGSSAASRPRSGCTPPCGVSSTVSPSASPSSTSRRAPTPTTSRRCSSRSSSASPQDGPTDRRAGGVHRTVRAGLAQRPGVPGGAGGPHQPVHAAPRRPRASSTPTSTGSAR